VAAGPQSLLPLIARVVSFDFMTIKTSASVQASRSFLLSFHLHLWRCHPRISFRPSLLLPLGSRTDKEKDRTTRIGLRQNWQSFLRGRHAHAQRGQQIEKKRLKTGPALLIFNLIGRPGTRGGGLSGFRSGGNTRRYIEMAPSWDRH
jgi:hypothetical protein